MPVPVLPSQLPAFPFHQSVSGTQSTTGSRAWPSVYTGTWGRSRTTSARRTRSSDLHELQGRLRSFQGLVLVLAFDHALCHFVFSMDEGGLTKRHSKKEKSVITMLPFICIKMIDDRILWWINKYWAKQLFSCSPPCFTLVKQKCRKTKKPKTV